MSNAAGLAALCAATNLLTVEQMSKKEKESASSDAISLKWAPAFSSSTVCGVCGTLSSASIPTGYTVEKPHEPAAPEPKQQPKLRMPNKKKKKGYPYVKFER